LESLQIFASIAAAIFLEELEALGLRGIIFTSTSSNRDYLLQAVAVEQIKAPKIPLMFEFRPQEPCAC
jgi:hypothetical protein